MSDSVRTAPRPLPLRHAATQGREGASGKFGRYGSLERLCSCGAPLGDHDIDPPHAHAETSCERFQEATVDMALDRRGKTLNVGDAVREVSVPGLTPDEGTVISVDGKYVYVRVPGKPTAEGFRSPGSSWVKQEAEMSARVDWATHPDPMAARCATFDALRGPDGKVRTGVWDKICVPGHDEKDGQSTDFDLGTLSQMAENFARRGDPVPIDHNHQSNYARTNGQPAPALGWYGALAVVWGGQVAMTTEAKGVSARSFGAPDPAQGDGLFGLRTEVTELGHELLPNFKLLSPTFTPNGTDRDGTPCGYMLAAVAATNTPWQAGTSITFTSDLGPAALGAGGGLGKIVPADGAPRASTKGARAMRGKLSALAKFVGMSADAPDEEIKKGLDSKMEDEAMAAVTEEGFPYDEHATKLEEASKAFEDANPEPDDGVAPHVAMRKMAAKFRAMGKMGKMGDPPFGGKETASEEKAEEASKEMARNFAQRLGVSLGGNLTSAQMFDALKAQAVGASQLPAMIDAQVAKRLAERDAAATRATFAQRAEQLVAMAIDGGYPAHLEADLRKAASDPATFDAIEASVQPFIRQASASAATNPLLFEQQTFGGAPRGAPEGFGRTSAAASTGGLDRKVIENELATFVEDGGRFSKMAEDMADSRDPVVMAKVDALLSESEITHPGLRLIAANRVLKAERPDLWNAAEKPQLFGAF